MSSRFTSLSRIRPLAKFPLYRCRQRNERLYSSRGASLESRDTPRIPVISVRERRAFENVLKNIVSAESKAPKQLTNKSFEKSQATIERFPEEIRSLVRNAEHEVLYQQYVSSLKDAQYDVKEALSPEEARELQEEREACKQRYTKVTKAMSQATTDFGILDNLETIFKFALEYEKEQGNDSSPGIMLEVYYSQILSFALNELNAHYPKSPVYLHIYNKMKSIGRRSHALGASTELYNLLMELACKDYRSDTFRALLAEMDSLGLDFDGKTLGIVDRILAVTKQAGAIDNGVVGDYPCLDKARETEVFEDWRERILQRIGENESRNAAAFHEMARNSREHLDSD
jgi:hypothetical protein